MDYKGIEIENEFFPSGTLSQVLKVEIKDLISQWNELDDESHPIKRISRFADDYKNALNKIRNSENVEQNVELYQVIQQKLVEALGYDFKVQTVLTALEESKLIPIIGKVSDSDGNDALWILQVPLGDKSDESSDPLGECFAKSQFPVDVLDIAETKLTIENIISDGIFKLPNPPKFLLVLSVSQIVLIERRKWPANSLVRFDLQELFTSCDEGCKQQKSTAMACLISCEARVPNQGVPIADRIEEEAMHLANAVTSSLKRTVRDAIEVLGQEVLDVTGGKYPAGDRRGIWIDGPDLSQECLRFMYRMLFLFYVEANPRLNILQKNNSAYMKGYSLEMLRELESTRLRTQIEREGTFLWDSLQNTLKLFFSGEDNFLKIPAIRVSLLSPESTPLLNSVRLRNEAIQKIIKLLSLKSSKKSTSRISYAKLGIGQLGAVYETLISFTGVVAKSDLIQIVNQKGKKKAETEFSEEVDEELSYDDGSLDQDTELENNESDHSNRENLPETSIRNDTVDPLAPSYFVARSRIDEFKSEDIVYENNQVLVYPKGTFMYRLAGRDREKSASYYTPEPLARLLVRHALMELCDGLRADQILELKILEPAMGSAAFLVEATNQLADLYLERKQKETNEKINPNEVIFETQKVRSLIADRNCFGVDLNPIASELGAISLWLNGLHSSKFAPWFGDQLHAGNSLIGARRASFSSEMLSTKKKDDLWLYSVPTEIGWKTEFPENHVWQWLLPANGMVNYDKGKLVKDYAEGAGDQIKKWKKGGFFDRLEPHEIELLQKLSKKANDLFERVAKDLAETRSLTNDATTIWPDKKIPGNESLDYQKKTLLNEYVTGIERATNTLPYKRLKTAMDAWCALWFWPIDNLSILPNRTEFLHGMAVILEGGYKEDGTISAESIEEFPDPTQLLNLIDPNIQKNVSRETKTGPGLNIVETEVEALVETFEWLKVSVEVAKREKFVHFDLIFADIMKVRGGFDLVLGNPPWLKPAWKEKKFLSDIDPKFLGLDAADAKVMLPLAMKNRDNIEKMLSELVSVRGLMEVTSSKAMTPFLGGGQNNLYRCFIDLSFRLVASKGCVALIHQDSHLSDPNSGILRENWYKRIRKHFHFINVFKKKNFNEVHPATEFSINVYRGKEGEVDFENFLNALLPSQIEDSYRHDGIGEIPAIKDIQGKNWNTKGHKKRIVKIKKYDLKTIFSLSELCSNGDLTSKFYQPINVDILEIISKFSKHPKFGESGVVWQNSRMWDEVGSQKKLKIIKKKIDFCKKNEEVILNGPMIFVANSYYKVPKRRSITNSDYNCLNIVEIPNDYIQRTKYFPIETSGNFEKHIPYCNWNSNLSYIDHFRFAFRRMTNSMTERTFVGALIPNGVTHVDSLNSISFENESDLIRASAAWVSLPFDFLLKLSGIAVIDSSDLILLPWLKLNQTAFHHILRLSCITTSYSDFWLRNFENTRFERWSSDDKRLSRVKLSKSWNRESAYRSDFERRMALVELDVIVAQELGLSLEELIKIYKIHFPIMQKYENNTWYDKNGQIVWPKSNGLKGVGWLDESGNKPSQSDWEKILEEDPTELSCIVEDDTLPGGPRKVERHFVGPFDKCDRIEDYKRAWTHFEELREKGLL